MDWKERERSPFAALEREGTAKSLPDKLCGNSWHAIHFAKSLLRSVYLLHTRYARRSCRKSLLPGGRGDFKNSEIQIRQEQEGEKVPPFPLLLPESFIPLSDVRGGFLMLVASFLLI